MRMTALVKSRDHVCCRYRIAAYRAQFESMGHALEIQPWSGPWLVRQLLPGFSCGADVLIVQRKLLPAWQLNLLRRRVRWLIFDFDDSIFLRSSYNPLGIDCPRRFAKFRHMVQAADIVIGGNEFLCEQAASLTRPHKVHLIPTCIEVGRYSLAPHRSDSSVKLTWIGSASTIRGLEQLRPTLEGVGKALPGLELKVICDRSLELSHLKVDFRRWGESTEAIELADADIGISWLPDDGWSAGKCGLKLLQYLAAGLPVVANAVGLQAKLVRPGETGFLAETPAEWESAIHRLAQNPEMRRRMGRAGRRLVESEYEVTRGAAGWHTALQSLRVPLAA